MPIGVLFDLASGESAVFTERHVTLLLNTLLLTALTVAGTIFVGVPLALMTALVRLPFRTALLTVLAAPLAMPSYLGAFSFFAAFGPGGEIETSLGLETGRVEGLGGAALIMALYTYPFVMLSTRAALIGQDANLVNAARTMGMSLTACLWRVMLPRAKNSIAAGALLSGLYALSDFATPAIMGVDTYTRAIYVEYNAFGLGQAALLSLHLVILVAIVLVLEAQFRAVQENPGRPITIWLKPWQNVCLFLLVCPVILFAIALPLGLFTVWLVQDGMGGFDFTIALQSTYASLLAAAAALVLALPVAYAARTPKVGKIMERLTYFGFGIPGIVMGTALVYVGLKLPILYQTLTVLVLAYAMRFLPLAVGSLRTSMDDLDQRTVFAARTLGASPFEAFRRVTLPLMIRGVIVGAALVFLEAMRELPATLLLAPTGFETLATYLWRMYEAGYFGRAALPGFLLVVLSALGLGLMLKGEQRAELGVIQGDRH
jgi:iron(III) transport system permease protein